MLPSLPRIKANKPHDSADGLALNRIRVRCCELVFRIRFGRCALLGRNYFLLEAHAKADPKRQAEDGEFGGRRDRNPNRTAIYQGIKHNLIKPATAVEVARSDNHFTDELCVM